MIENVMDELANIQEERKKELERKIQYKKELIADIKKRNPNSGDLSFDEYQLYCLEQELKELENSI